MLCLPVLENRTANKHSSYKVAVSLSLCYLHPTDSSVQKKLQFVPRGGGVLIYFSVRGRVSWVPDSPKKEMSFLGESGTQGRGRAAEQDIIFRTPTPGQGIIFVKSAS